MEVKHKEKNGRRGDQIGLLHGRTEHHQQARIEGWQGDSEGRVFVT